MTQNEKNLMEYDQGYVTGLTHRHLKQEIIRRLRASIWFHNGFHDARPKGCKKQKTTILEDPTRPGGWCCTIGEDDSPAESVAEPGRAMTQTALVVHNGKTQLALDVQRGKRRLITTQDGAIVQTITTAKPKKSNANQGELFQ